MGEEIINNLMIKDDVAAFTIADRIISESSEYDSMILLYF